MIAHTAANAAGLKNVAFGLIIPGEYSNYSKKSYPNYLMAAGFELFSHTADLGVRARGGSAEELLNEAAKGLYAACGLRPETAAPIETIELEIRSADKESLLRDFLAELLYLLNEKGKFAAAVRLESFSANALDAAADLAAAGATPLEREVKAVTYHGLEWNEADGSFECSFIVDI